MQKLADFIWMDGSMVSWEDAKVHVLSHALHYGSGVFEGIRCYETSTGPAVFRLPEHVTRLFNSAKICQINIPFTQAEVTRAIVDTIKKNNLPDCYIRPIVFLGLGAMGLFPKNNRIHVSVAAWPWGAYLGDDGIKNGIKLRVSSYTRHHVNAAMTRSKTTGYYMNSVLAKLEAHECGCDDALLLDASGYVAEASGANIFIVRDSVLMTPPLTSVLDGITRDTVMKLARELGIEVREHRFTRDEIYTADEAFLTGTAAELTPVRELDSRIIGPPGPITRKLQSLYFDVVKGKSAAHTGWLFPV